MTGVRQTLQRFLQVSDELGHVRALDGERVLDAAIAVGLDFLFHEPRPDQVLEAAGCRGWAPHEPLELREVHRLSFLSERVKDPHRPALGKDINLQRTPAEKVYYVQFNRSCPKYVVATIFVFIDKNEIGW